MAPQIKWSLCITEVNHGTIFDPHCPSSGWCHRTVNRVTDRISFHRPGTQEGSDIPQEYTKDGFNEVARMLYSPAKKRIVASLDGQYYRTAGEMTEEKQARLAKVLRLWTEWSKTPAETTEAQQVTIEPASQAAEVIGIVNEAQPEPPASEGKPEGEFVSPFEEKAEMPPSEEPEGAFESSLFESRLEEMSVSGGAIRQRGGRGTRTNP